jgi:hypothetical protein
MKWLIALALFIGLSGNASGDEPEGQGYGLGMRSCAQFAGDYQAQPTVAENTYYVWAEGFMSGLNLESTVARLPNRNLASIDMQAAQVEIRSYCNAHPLAPYYGAVVEIYNKLPMLSQKPR